MAHIPDGILSVPVLVGGFAVAAGGLALAVRRLDERAIAPTALLAAVFFVASLVSVPVGPSSVHLLLAGLMGLLIGVRTFAAVAAGLVLQAVLFGFGGLTTLGINIMDIALPGVVFGLLLRPVAMKATPFGAGLAAGLCAALSVAGTAGLVSLALALSSTDYVPAARVLALTYVPLMAGEAVVTGFIVAFLRRVRPESFLPPGKEPVHG